MRLKNNQPLRCAISLLCLALVVFALYTRYRYREAETFLDGINFKARNVSGTMFYASPKRLFVGQQLSRKEVIDHLKAINFSETDRHDVPGSYVLEGANVLHIVPRLAEFRPVTVFFSGNRIVRLGTANAPQAAPAGDEREAFLEPEVLGSFITTIQEDEASKMYVRRYTLQPADVMESDIFFATLASEDATFLSHHGVSYASYLRAPYYYLRGRRVGGASTISAQVVKNAISLDKTHSLSRKFDELFVTATLEERMTKEQIFTLYANSIFLGGGKGSPNIYGFLAAADEYFGKHSLKELTLSEACTLVAMLPKPSYFLTQAKQNNYAELTGWRDRVLDRLREVWPDRFSQQAIDEAKRAPVVLVTRPQYQEQPLDVVSRGFIEYASRQQPLLNLNGLSPTEYSGLHVYCSIDPDLMRESQRIVSKMIPAIERRFPPAVADGCQGEKDRMLATIVALDPRTGDIISMYGGAGGKDGAQYGKIALNALGSPASTIKPFWVARALTGATLPDGSPYTAASVINPRDASLLGWRSEIGTGGSGRVRTLLSASRDDFAVYTLNLIGLRQGVSLYEDLTGSSIKVPTGQLAIGFGSGTEISPLKLASIYSVFAGAGRLSEPSTIGRVYLDGRELPFQRTPPRQVVDAGAAFVTTQMLRSVLGEGLDGRAGTASRAFHLSGVAPGVEIGGKTGSGPNDVWMVSVSPKLIVVTWVGYQCHSQIKNYEKLYASETASMVWAEFLKSVNRFRPDLLGGSFERPANVEQLGIDPAHGCRTERAGSMQEFFIEGRVPRPCEARP
jgi:penicillin-binding protein 1A